MIQVENLGHSFSGQELFSGASFLIGNNEKIGLVGRNGTGKSTLLKILQREMTAEDGNVSWPKDLRVGALRQHLEFTHSTVLDECKASLPEELEYEVYRVEKILTGLGIGPELFNMSPHEFSGGMQIRVELAKVLVSGPDMLFLDEPTNYLDILGLRWLRQYLQRFQGPFILITHDRAFMDSVSTHILGIYGKKLRKVKGKTEQYYFKLSEEQEILEKAQANQEKKRQHLEKFVERFGAKASKASQAQARLKQLDKMERIDGWESEQSMRHKFQYEGPKGRELGRVSGLSFGYEADCPLIQDLGIYFNQGDCIGVIGKNGKGKSTLLNVLRGELEAQAGEIYFHSKAKIAYFGQTNVQRLNPENTVIEEIATANDDLSNQAVRSIAGAMLFEGELAKKKIKVLSGGEKSRVELGKIMGIKSNILFLDEPTNHLDMESIELLAQEIKDYPGVVLLVTHSEDLLSKIANKLIVFRKGSTEVFEGGYSDFLDKVGWEEEDKGQKDPEEKVLGRKELKAQRAQAVKERANLRRPLVTEMEKLEPLLEKIDSKCEKIQKQLLEASEKSDGAAIEKFSKELGALEADLEAKLEEMASLEDQLDEINQRFEKVIMD